MRGNAPALAWVRNPVVTQILTRISKTVNDSRRLPWLSGLIAAITIAAWLIYAVIADAVSVITSVIDTR